PGFVQDLQGVLVSCDVELIAHRTVEGTALVGADLGRDAEAAQQAEGAPRDGGVRNVEMHGDLPAALEVDAAGRVEEARELRQPVAVAPRCDRRELAAQVLRE